MKRYGASRSMRVVTAAALLLFGCIPSLQAATVLLNGADNNNATGILDLDIAGKVYDVTFEFVTGTDSNPIDSFGQGDIFTNATGADEAVTAINNELDKAGALTIGTSKFMFIVPYSFDNACMDFCAYRSRNTTGHWVNNGDASIDNLASIEFARFAPAVVNTPVPPALYLFSTGLAVLAVFRRRRSKVSVNVLAGGDKG